jgi:hypothetical protein
MLQKLGALLTIAGSVAAFILPLDPSKVCNVKPLGHGRDDTSQVQAAIDKCGHFGTTAFAPGVYNITRKMTWDLQSAKVDLRGYLNFQPDIDFWLDARNTYRVVFIQSQASWFVVTGSDFEIDAHNTGGIQGNGQPWWSAFAAPPRTRQDGDGRPIALTLWKVARGVVRNFRIESPPFWSNAVAQSTDVTYDGMFINATNEDPKFFGQNIVFNTDGIDTYRSDKISMLNWDVTCGDDCLAIKGNSTNILARNITCRGGTGVAVGSLGQYVNMRDDVLNVLMEDIRVIRHPNRESQPLLANGIYFKSWDGSVNGAPPTGGGGANGTVSNFTARNVVVEGADVPLHLFQTNLAQPGDLPSKLIFEDLHFINWTGVGDNKTVVDIECSPAVGCHDITFEGFQVKAAAGEKSQFICQNTVGVHGLDGCTPTGQN